MFPQEAFKRYRLVDSMFTTFDEHCDGVAARLKRWKLKEKDISLAELGRATRVIVLNALTFEHYLDPPQRGNCFDVRTRASLSNSSIRIKGSLEESMKPVEPKVLTLRLTSARTYSWLPRSFDS